MIDFFVHEDLLTYTFFRHVDPYKIKELSLVNHFFQKTFSKNSSIVYLVEINQFALANTIPFTAAEKNQLLTEPWQVLSLLSDCRKSSYMEIGKLQRLLKVLLTKCNCLQVPIASYLFMSAVVELALRLWPSDQFNRPLNEAKTINFDRECKPVLQVLNQAYELTKKVSVNCLPFILLKRTVAGMFFNFINNLSEHMPPTIPKLLRENIISENNCVSSEKSYRDEKNTALAAFITQNQFDAALSRFISLTDSIHRRRFFCYNFELAKRILALITALNLATKEIIPCANFLFALRRGQALEISWFFQLQFADNHTIVRFIQLMSSLTLNHSDDSLLPIIFSRFARSNYQAEILANFSNQEILEVIFEVEVAEKQDVLKRLNCLTKSQASAVFAVQCAHVISRQQDNDYLNLSALMELADLMTELTNERIQALLLLKPKFAELAKYKNDCRIKAFINNPPPILLDLNIENYFQLPIELFLKFLSLVTINQHLFTIPRMCDPVYLIALSREFKTLFSVFTTFTMPSYFSSENLSFLEKSNGTTIIPYLKKLGFIVFSETFPFVKLVALCKAPLLLKALSNVNHKILLNHYKIEVLNIFFKRYVNDRTLLDILANDLPQQCTLDLIDNALAADNPQEISPLLVENEVLIKLCGKMSKTKRGFLLQSFESLHWSQLSNLHQLTSGTNGQSFFDIIVHSNTEISEDAAKTLQQIIPIVLAHSTDKHVASFLSQCHAVVDIVTHAATLIAWHEELETNLFFSSSSRFSDFFQERGIKCKFNFESPEEDVRNKTFKNPENSM